MDWITAVVAIGGVSGTVIGTVAGAWVTAHYGAKNVKAQAQAGVDLERSRQQREEVRERAEVLADVGSELFARCQRLKARRSRTKPERKLSDPPGWGEPTEHGFEVNDEIGVLHGMAARLAVRDPEIGEVARDLIEATGPGSSWEAITDRFFGALSAALSKTDYSSGTPTVASRDDRGQPSG